MSNVALTSDAGRDAPDKDRGCAWRLATVYVLVVAAVLLAVTAVVHFGSLWLSPPTAAAIGETVGAARPMSAHASAGPLSPIATLLLQLLVIISVAHVLSQLARRIGQPPVVGEMIAGIALGPTLFGRIWPEGAAFIFPPASLGTLQLMSQFGVILYLFTVGLNVNVSHLRRRAHVAVAISHFSIILPFALGVLAAVGLYGSYAPADTDFGAFALFIGIAMSVTAFPVLARILDDRHLSRTPLGSTALTCAAVDDITAWALLAVIIAFVTSGGTMAALLTTVGGSVAFVVLMIYVIQPLLAASFGRQQAIFTAPRMSVVLAIMFAAALATELAGAHALFGAFVAGTIVPAAGRLRENLRTRLDSLCAVVFLPIFFVFTGLRTEIGMLRDPVSWLVCAGVILIAIAGKLLGTMLAARWTGLSWYPAFVLGALMNTRGLMELIVLNVGLDLGILSPRMFTMLVLMALTTTAMTCPLIDAADALARRARRRSIRTAGQRTLEAQRAARAT